jgi:hypothetical protein
LSYTGQPPGKRKRGRPRTTWRRIITSEQLEEMGFSMGQAQYVIKDRRRWRQIVDALCPWGMKRISKYVIMLHTQLTEDHIYTTHALSHFF